MGLFTDKNKRAEKPQVLIVEDNERQSQLLAQIVNETELYQALVAYNGNDALAILDANQRGFDFLTNRISCILLDWQMPEMNGEEFLKRLREKENKNPFKRHIPVVIVSAYGDSERRMLAEDASFGLASAYLLKPFDEAELLNVLKRIVINKEGEIMRELMIEQRSRWLEEFRKDL